MADTSVLSELKDDVVPHWSARLEKYLPDTPAGGMLLTPAQLTRPAEEASCDNSSTKRIGEKPLVLVGPEMFEDTPTQTTPDFPSPRITPGGRMDDKQKQASKLLSAPHGLCRLEAKPEPAKSRFSSITGPTVWYDGESQLMLNDLWTAMNNRRGGLRKEMMMLKRRLTPSMPASMRRTPIFTIPMTASDDEDEEGEKKDGENEDEDSSEVLRMRLRLDRERMNRMNRRGPPPGANPTMAPGIMYKRARMGGPDTATDSSPSKEKDKNAFDEDKYKALLEAIDENLDKACKVTETAAFTWLKGEEYGTHLKFILAKLKDIAVKVEQSGFVVKEEGEKSSETGKAEEKKSVDSMSVDTVMAPPQLPPQQQAKQYHEIAKRKSDITMRDAEPLMPSLMTQPESTPIPAQQQQNGFAPVTLAADTPVVPQRDDKMSVQSAIMEVGIEVDN